MYQNKDFELGELLTLVAVICLAFGVFIGAAFMWVVR